MQLDHVTLRTSDIAASGAFLAAVLDLEDRPRPASIRHIPGKWLYAGDKPIIHLLGSRASTGGETFDHIAFRGDDYVAFKARLAKLGVPFSTALMPETGDRQIFFRTPGGPLIEAIFEDASPQGAIQ